MYLSEIKIETAAALLALCNLGVPTNAEITLGLFENDQLIATASLKGEIIQGVAVHPDFQGADLTAKLLTELIARKPNLYLFTKTQNVRLFEGLGFNPLAIARPYAALLEYGRNAEEYKHYLMAKKGDYQDTAHAVVVNCNPFTLGHRYLIETAAKGAQRLYVIVVEEDLSDFSFAERYEMVKRGTADMPSVVVLKSGRYAVSSLTFPSYFTRETETAKAGAAIDAELFCNLFAPILHICKRVLGSEPSSPITAIYNEALQERLPKHEIAVEILPRKESGGAAISASTVRALLKEGKLQEVEKLVPTSTLKILKNCNG